MTALDDAVHAGVVRDPAADVAASCRRHALALAPLLAPAELDALVARVRGPGRRASARSSRSSPTPTSPR